MITSTTIKQRQYQPIEGTRRGNSWTFQSESRERVRYSVLRDGREYKCGCPATGLCKHITSAVIEDAKAKFEIVQVWTDQTDAKRQKRRTIQMSANGHPFWVTFAQGSPLAGVVRFCETWGKWGKGSVDLYYRNEDGSDRCETVSLDYDELEGIAQREGWTQIDLYWWAP